MWRAFVRSGRLGPGCLVLRSDTRENLVGKNGVMTVAPSLFGSIFARSNFLGFCAWLRLPAVHLDLRASPSRVQIGIPGLGEDRSGCEKTVRSLKC